MPASDKQIQLGSRKRIVVYDGEVSIIPLRSLPWPLLSLPSLPSHNWSFEQVGISYVNGKLDILPPKEHVFDAAERVFVNFLSTRQQSIPLGEGNASTGHFLRCDTKDFVEIGMKRRRWCGTRASTDLFIIGIQAAVFYRISDPEKAVLTVGDANAIEKLVKETSTATLQVLYLFCFPLLVLPLN